MKENVKNSHGMEGTKEEVRRAAEHSRDPHTIDVRTPYRLMKPLAIGPNIIVRPYATDPTQAASATVNIIIMSIILSWV